MALYIGTEIRLRAEWHKPVDPDNVPSETDPLADPTDVSLEILKDNVRLILWNFGIDSGIAKDAVGKYHALYTLTQSGLHTYIWRGTGAAAQVISGTFYVQEL